MAGHVPRRPDDCCSFVIFERPGRRLRSVESRAHERHPPQGIDGADEAVCASQDGDERYAVSAHARRAHRSNRPRADRQRVWRRQVPIIATLNAGDAILTLAGLGFLGFGIEPSSAAEWGYDVNKSLSDTAAGIWWTGLFPGLAIVLMVLGVTLVGESLNDVLNPVLRTTRLRRVVLPRRRTDAAVSS